MKNVLTDHIIVSSVGGEASTRIQPTEPTYLAANWGIGLEVARPILECTTQRRLWAVLHTSLGCRFRKNDRQFRYRRLRHDVFSDTFLSGTNSKRVNKYSEVFVTKF